MVADIPDAAPAPRHGRQRPRPLRRPALAETVEPQRHRGARRGKEENRSIILSCSSASSRAFVVQRSSKMERHVVARAEEIPPGGRKIVRIAGRGEIGVFNVDGAFYALKNTCAHQGCAGLPRQDRRHGAAVGGLRVSLRAGGGHPALPVARVGVRHQDRRSPSSIRTSKSSPIPSKWWMATSPLLLT